MDQRTGDLTTAAVALRVVDVYVYRRRGTDPEFLLLKRAPDHIYAGTWRMIGGKIRADERAWEAAYRELVEETHLRPDPFWALPSVNVFYEWDADRINLTPAFAAEVAADPVLDDEHIAFEWLSADDAVDRLVWPEQQRLLALTDRLLARPLPEAWIIPQQRLERI